MSDKITRLDDGLVLMLREIQAYLACSASTPADIVMTYQVFGTKRPLRLPARKLQAQQEYVRDHLFPSEKRPRL